MKCPHCSKHFHEDWRSGSIAYGHGNPTRWEYQMTLCAACRLWIIRIMNHDNPSRGWRQVEPIGSDRGPTPVEVPADIAEDYQEACLVLPLSAKASAALARRCLQNILHRQGYKARDLAKEIDLLLNEADPKKAIPQSLHDTIDSIRNFGNFSAHPITDVTSLQVVDVEPEEAEWCLAILEEMFEHFYVKPAQAAAKKAALNAKLAGAGKPAAK